MSQKLSLLLLCGLQSFSTLYTMEISPKKDRKSITRTLSEKSPLPFRKKNRSRERLILSPPTTDTRLANIAEETEDNISDRLIIDPHTINKTYSYHKDTLLTWATLNNKSLLVLELLTYKNITINHQNEYGNSALHYCAKHSNKALIKKFLRDPRVDASLTNKEGKTAREMVEKLTDDHLKLRRIIFARIMLDLTINTIFNTTSDRKKSHPNFIITAVKQVKENIIKDQNRQEKDENLPEEAKLPVYATDDFITAIISYRLQEYFTGDVFL